MYVREEKMRMREREREKERKEEITNKYFRRVVET